MALAANPKKIDQSTIPPAVRRAAAEADRLQKETIATQQPPAPGPEQTPPFSSEPQQPPQEPPAASSEAPPAAAAPERPPESLAALERPPEPAPDDLSWKEKYEGQVGRTRRAQQDMQAMSARV